MGKPAEKTRLEDLGVKWQYVGLQQTYSTNDVHRADVAQGREDSPASVTPTVNLKSYTKRGNSSDQLRNY